MSKKLGHYLHADAVLPFHVQQVSIISPQKLWEFDETLNTEVEIRNRTVHVLRFLHVKGPLSGRISSNTQRFNGWSASHVNLTTLLDVFCHANWCPREEDRLTNIFFKKVHCLWHPIWSYSSVTLFIDPRVSKKLPIVVLFVALPPWWRDLLPG